MQPHDDTLHSKGTFINDVPRFLAIFDLPTYLVLLYNVPSLGQSWKPLPTLVWDVINECSLREIEETGLTLYYIFDFELESGDLIMMEKIPHIFYVSYYI